MLELTRNTLLEENINHPMFLLECAALVEDIEQAIAVRLPDVASSFELEDDEITVTAAKNAMLHKFISFVLQRDIPASEVLDVRYHKFEQAKKWFFRNESPTGESVPTPVSDRVKELEIELTKLKAENQKLREEQAIAAMRRKPSRRNKPIFANLDEYIQFITKVAEIATADLEDFNAGTSYA